MTLNRPTVLLTAFASLMLGAGAVAQSGQPGTGPGVDPTAHAAHAAAVQQPGATPGDVNKELIDQLAALRAEVAKLQAEL